MGTHGLIEYVLSKGTAKGAAHKRRVQTMSKQTAGITIDIAKAIIDAYEIGGMDSVREYVRNNKGGNWRTAHNNKVAARIANMLDATCEDKPFITRFDVEDVVNKLGIKFLSCSDNDTAEDYQEFVAKNPVDDCYIVSGNCHVSILHGCVVMGTETLFENTRQNKYRIYPRGWDDSVIARDIAMHRCVAITNALVRLGYLKRLDIMVDHKREGAGNGYEVARAYKLV